MAPLRWWIFTALTLLMLAPARYSYAQQPYSLSLEFAASEAALENPYIGNGIWADEEDDPQQPFSLVYADLTWAEFEPSKGFYDFASFESRNQFTRWRAEGKHVIFRFILDEPGDERHLDIPRWLYEEIDGDGERYSIPYGRGFSPNYANETLIRAHAKAIAALGARYGQDSLFAYVQMGSLGHWGEWHTYDDLEDLPPESVREAYVRPYETAFPNAYIMMRRPFTHAWTRGWGLYNDASGHLKSTEDWLEWIEHGGTFYETGERNAMQSMTNIWKTAPIGGELTTYLEPEELLEEDYEQTLALFARSHTSWIGPGSFAEVERGGDLQKRLDALMRGIGYRLRVSRMELRAPERGDIEVTLVFENDGNAPFYFDWQPSVMVRPGDGGDRVYPLDFSITEVLPGEPYQITVSLPREALAAGECEVYVGILNPDTQQPGIALAMETEQDGRWHLLCRVDLSE